MSKDIFILAQRKRTSHHDPRWYLKRDGTPPEEDDNSYIWNGFQWIRDWDYDEIEVSADELEDYEERRLRKVAEQGEF